MGNLTHSAATNKPVIVPKNSVEELRMALDEYRGHPYADIRIYYRADDSTMKPSRKGITVSPDHWPAFVDGLHRLEEQMDRRGLLDGQEDG